MVKEFLTADQYLYHLLTMLEAGGPGQEATAKWQAQETASSATSAPSSSSDGIDVTGAVSCFIGCIFDTATKVDFQIWCMVDGVWGTPRLGKLTELDASYVERANTVGIERVYLQVLSTDGSVLLKIAPVTY